MLRQNISIADSSVTKTGISAKHFLIVKISKNNMVYSVLDTSQNTFVAFGSWIWPAEEEFSGLTHLTNNFTDKSFILKQNFGKTLILLDSDIYTLIPEKLFITERAKEYLEFSHTFNSNENIASDNISKISAKNIYWLPSDIENLFAKTLMNFEYRHVATILINSALINTPHRKQVNANISGNRLDIIVTDNNRLNFCNSFFFDTAQDIIYYLFNVYRQQNIKTSIPLLLTGEIDKDSLAFTTIYKYIRNISFTKNSEIYQYCSEMKELKLTSYYSLFNAFLCV